MLHVLFSFHRDRVSDYRNVENIERVLDTAETHDRVSIIVEIFNQRSRKSVTLRRKDYVRLFKFILF